MISHHIDFKEIFQPLMAISAEVGVNMEQLLLHAGLNPEKLLSDKASVTAGEINQIFLSIGTLTDDPCFGLKIGSAIRFETLGPMGGAMATAPTPLDAINQVVAAFKNFSVFDAKIDKNLLHFSYLPPEQYQVDKTYYFHDSALSGFLSLAGIVLKDSLALEAIHLKHKQHQHLSRYEAFFGCPVKLNAPATCAILQAEPFLLAMSTSSTLANEQQIELVKKTLERNFNPTPFSKQISDCIFTYLGEKLVTIDLIAADQGLSARTLQRRLREEGSAYQQLFDQARSSYAKDRLESSNDSLTDIAAELGFSSSDAFSTSFKSWEGEAPSAYRKAKRKANPSN